MIDFDPIGLLSEQYKILGHEGLGFTEIRIPKKGIQRFVENEDDFVKEASAYCKGDVYVGINPRRVKSGKESDVSYITAIVFDFDPIRPKDSPSTDEQHKEALKIASDFSSFINGLLVSSGSGAHVYMPISPIPVSDVHEASQSLRNFAKEIQEKYTTGTTKVDSTFDLPRIIRCWGSTNTKSNRPCSPVSEVQKTCGRREFKLSDYAAKETPATLQNIQSRGCVEILSTSGSVEDKFKEAIKKDSTLQKIMEKRALYPSRSESDFAFGTSLFRLGFSVREVSILLPKNPLGKASNRSQNDLDREVNRIYEKIKTTIKISSPEMDADNYIKDLSNRAPGIMTGFERWDQMTAGLKGGRFYVDAGRPTEGKTTRLVQVAMNVAGRGHRVLYFPTECAKNVIYDKMVSAKSNVNLRKFQFGNFNSEEREKINIATKEVMKLPITIAENFRLKLHDIVSAIKNTRPDYVVIDFLNGMSYNDVNNPSELGANVMGIKALGKDYNIPITLAAQLHRKQPNTEYSLSDLKGTGKLEEEGDIITFLHTVNSAPYPAHSRAIVLKNKFGEPGTIKMNFYRGVCRFEEVGEWSK